MTDSDTTPNSNSTPSPAQNSFEKASTFTQAIITEIKKVFVGQDDIIEQVLVALIGGGHVLLEGVPGLGKTLLIRSLSKCFGGDFSRVQFTPDLMPSDITGHAMFNAAKQEFEIRKGPIFTNLLLADEINRAPAKTQAALLEVMQEGQVTIEGESFSIDSPFMVMATQNPVEQEGTYPLPEAELDRFMLKILIDYPSAESEFAMLAQMSNQNSAGNFNLNPIKTLMQGKHIEELRSIAKRVTIDDEVLNYIVKLTRATREWSGIVRGAGPRASIALMSASRALALIRGAEFVTPDDVKQVLLPALRHRILLSAAMEIEGVNTDEVLRDISISVEAPRH